MEKEVTSLDFSSMIVDGIYKVIMFVLCVNTAFYVANEKGFVLLVILSIIAIVLKTLVGLFNFSVLVDILQYYMDLGISLFIGRSMGIIYQGYISDFYNFEFASLIVAAIISLILFVLRSKTINRRSYYGLLR